MTAAGVAEAIAEVVADIRAGRVVHPAAFDAAGVSASARLLRRAQVVQPVVDCTAIFKMQMAQSQIDLYGDHPLITPSWESVMLAYVNTFGNVIVMQVHRKDWDGSTPSSDDWYTENEVDWPRVRWIAETAVWVGGRSGDGQPMPASGPCHMFRHAIHDDGSPADINWLRMLGPRGQRCEVSDIDDDTSRWDSAMVTLGASLNFLNASNVEIAEPARSRPERRRLARMGVQVQAIVIRPPGKRRIVSTGVRPIGANETVFSPVRGHWARYGPEHGRGLLFGKHSGRFWIAAHARGAGEGEAKDYVLRPGATL